MDSSNVIHPYGFDAKNSPEDRAELPGNEPAYPTRPLLSLVVITDK